MGIQGLLPLLKQVTESIHVKRFSGKTVAIDASCWLHRGAHVCATELCLEIPTNKYAIWCMKRIYMLLENGIKPHVVFDGAQMPLKKDTESKRRDSREDHLSKGRAFHAAGNSSVAAKHFQRAVRVSPSMVCMFIQMLRDEGITFTVAPYEADAQLAFLARNGLVDAVISEDSDLLAFGCPKVIFKMDDGGNGQLVSLDRVVGSYGLLRPLNLEKFRQMCILSGCDYLPSISGIGIKKAWTLIKQNKNVARMFKRIRWEVKYTIPKGYEEEFMRAQLGFCHQRVFDPVSQKLTHLTPLPQQFFKSFPDDSFLGGNIDENLVIKIASGLTNPRSREEYPKDVLRKLDPGYVQVDTKCEKQPWGTLSNDTRLALANAKRKASSHSSAASKSQSAMDSFVKGGKRTISDISMTRKRKTSMDSFITRTKRPMSEQSRTSNHKAKLTRGQSFPDVNYSSKHTSSGKSTSLHMNVSAVIKPFKMPEVSTVATKSTFFQDKGSLFAEKVAQQSLRKMCSLRRTVSCSTKRSKMLSIKLSTYNLSRESNRDEACESKSTGKENRAPASAVVSTGLTPDIRKADCGATDIDSQNRASIYSSSVGDEIRESSSPTVMLDGFKLGPSQPVDPKPKKIPPLNPKERQASTSLSTALLNGFKLGRSRSVISKTKEHPQPQRGSTFTSRFVANKNLTLGQESISLAERMEKLTRYKSCFASCASKTHHQDSPEDKWEDSFLQSRKLKGKLSSKFCSSSSSTLFSKFTYNPGSVKENISTKADSILKRFM